MHYSPYLLLAAATSAAAYQYTAKPAGRHMQAKRDGPLIDHESVATKCAPPIAPDSTTKKNLPWTELAGAQQQILDWCNDNKEIKPSLDTKGVWFSSGGTEAQICNTEQATVPCPSKEAIESYFEAIHCGTHQDPQLGGAMLTKAHLFFTYGPRLGLGNCQSKDDTLKSWDMKLP